MNLILCGMMGAGKTTVGVEVARLTGWRCLDTDALIEERYGKISEIFKARGEAYFRGLEAETVKELSKQDGLVISVGGGLVLKEERKYKKWTKHWSRHKDLRKCENEHLGKEMMRKITQRLPLTGSFIPCIPIAFLTLQEAQHLELMQQPICCSHSCLFSDYLQCSESLAATVSLFRIALFLLSFKIPLKCHLLCPPPGSTGFFSPNFQSHFVRASIALTASTEQ